ncbi:Hypothetical predicted protein [Olea europaea subsp. europaea]|uniref:Uncharacterized protein n=1 Tax=Olea europaea subsp. europaea TaxID=158383 RepID=A0A8S0VHB8_OLEEU|nr:Hypothetical predicted protein [Olea europaea subsp. europaea]
MKTFKNLRKLSQVKSQQVFCADHYSNDTYRERCREIGMQNYDKMIDANCTQESQTCR